MGQKQTSPHILGQTFLNCLSQILSPISAFFIFASGLSPAYQHPDGTEQTQVQHWEKQGDHFLATLPWINISVTPFIMIRDAYISLERQIKEMLSNARFATCCNNGKQTDLSDQVSRNKLPYRWYCQFFLLLQTSLLSVLFQQQTQISFL